ncbi:MAG: aminopeptidase P family protein [Deltaproteobacteria bacterium]|nr:aminopeptidase P family protein [Deltaproteobacteria bacterium]
MIKTPRSELYSRIQTLQSLLESDNVDGALIVHNVNLFYFCGTVQQAVLFVPADGETLLFARKNPDRVKNESSLDHVIPVKGIRDLRKHMADLGYGHFKKLGMELDVLPVNQYFHYKKMLNPDEIVDVWPAIRVVRMIKSEYEIDLLKKAAILSDYMLETARTHLREGISEVALSAEIERAARAKGHQGYIRMRGFNQEVYWGNLVSGPDAANPAFINFTTGGRGLSMAFPSGAGWKVVRKHEPVIVDLAAGLNGYNIDQTRTLCVGGLSERLNMAYHIAREIENALEAMIRPGVEAGALFVGAYKLAASSGLREHFMGYDTQKAGFIGHGIGLEMDELPVLAEKNTMTLEEGMVIAIEPNFAFPDEGVVGVEDTFVVTNNGCEKLTSASYDVVVDD